MTVPGPVAAETDAATASGYHYPLVLEDPEGDHAGLAGTPNAGNPENDIVEFAMTDDGQTLVMRFIMATCSFALPSGTVTVNVQLTGPNEEDWDVTVVYDNGCVLNGEPADFDPTSGDDDVLLPGARAEAVPEERAIYIFADHSATGLAEGDAVALDAISSGRGIRVVVGLTFTNQDTVDRGEGVYTLTDSAAGPPVDTGPELVEGTLEPGITGQVDLVFENATNATHTYTWNTTLNGTAGVTYEVALDNGSIQFTVTDGANTTVAEVAVTQAASDRVVANDVRPGTWRIQIVVEGAIGSIGLGIEAADAPSPESTMEPADNRSAPQENSTQANATLDESDGGLIPGLGAPAAFAGVVVALGIVRARRRRAGD